MKNNNKEIISAVDKYGTPAYFYDGEQLITNYQNLVNALPSCVDVFYALKVNPNVSLVKLLRAQGACTEVCSITEMEIALKAGTPVQDIIYLGPCKKDEELKKAIALNIFAIVIESEIELERVSSFAKELGITANVAIRINPDFSAEGSPWKMGGRPTHFGIEEQQAIRNFKTYLDTPNVNIRGIHVYNGTNILEAKSVYENTKYILGLYEKIVEKYNCEFTMVDVGGGMGIPYFNNQEELDLKEFRNLMVPLFNNFNKKFPNTRIIMESGRFIIGTAGSMAVKVNNMKSNHGKTFVVTDGGTNCHSAAAGSGRVVKRNFPMKNISNPDDSFVDKYQVSGPLCSPDDIIGRNIMLTKVNVSDILLVELSGAYGPTSSPGLFHSHGFPSEILLYRGETYLIRGSDTTEDIVNKQILVNFKQEELILS
ncbi:diaminopimelate decarboxylase [Aquimarina sp. BL5]|uniref:alanine racemase n=2 Tax=Aquimarina sp. BL5 TaxID=1714860 RepID=UPI000E548DC4|nr:alanine racemase [Aquimarina sp. BL5]AXT49412.1 diaminopimelate decarboxylase [Aquimarina sp. BL5]